MGADVDIVSGLPSEPVAEISKRNEAKIATLGAIKANADQLKESLASEAGQKVLQKIQEQLLNRINQLMSKDGECLALKKLLIGMGMEINMGEEAVKRLMRVVTRR